MDTVENIINGIKKGDRYSLAKAITLAESSLPEEHEKALQIIEHFGPQKGTIRIGITGTPGAGKSTLIDALGKHILNVDNQKVAVLSVDPSSTKTKGSILGDKTRMSELSSDANVFIRPSPSGNQLGGLAKNTRLAMLLCEAAGFGIIIIESVGVGQGETEIAQLTDIFTLVLNPGGGDELQGIKKGVMEMADIVLINKADGNNETTAKATAKEYKMALHLRTHQAGDWIPKVLVVSARENKNIDKLWQGIQTFQDEQPQYIIKNRTEQKKYWAKKRIEEAFLSRLARFEDEIESQIDKDILPERVAKNISKEF